MRVLLLAALPCFFALTIPRVPSAHPKRPAMVESAAQLRDLVFRQNTPLKDLRVTPYVAAPAASPPPPSATLEAMRERVAARGGRSENIARAPRARA